MRVPPRSAAPTRGRRRGVAHADRPAPGSATYWCPQFDAEGRLSGWDGVVMEVTEQRAMAVDLAAPRACSRRWWPTCLPAFSSCRGRPATRSWSTTAPASCSAAARSRRPGWARSRSTTFTGPTGRRTRWKSCPSSRPCAAAPPPCATMSLSTAPTAGGVPLVTWAAPVRLGGPGQADAAVWVLEDLTALSPGRGRPPRHRGPAADGRGDDGRGAYRPGSQPGRRRLQRRRLRCSAARRSKCGRRRCTSPGPACARTARPCPTRSIRSRWCCGRAGRCGTWCWGWFRRPRGADPRWFLVNAMPLAGGAATAGVVTTLSDVTAHPAGPGGAAAVGGEVPRPDRGDAAHAGPGRPGPACRIRQPRRARRNRIRDGGNRRPVGVGDFVHPDDLPACGPPPSRPSSAGLAAWSSAIMPKMDR